jgi:hypothetical protein
MQNSDFHGTTVYGGIVFFSSLSYRQKLKFVLELPKVTILVLKLLLNPQAKVGSNTVRHRPVTWMSQRSVPTSPVQMLIGLITRLVELSAHW